MIQKTALKRSTHTDYFALLSNLNADASATAIRDFDALTESIKKEKEKAKAGSDTEKAQKSNDLDKKRYKKAEKANAKKDDASARWGEVGDIRLGGQGEEEGGSDRAPPPSLT